MLYIAYGSNMSEKRMRSRCPSARLITKGYLNDMTLCFHYYADIEPAHDYATPAVLWDIPVAEVERLDREEGVPEHYQKEQIKLIPEPHMSHEEMIALVGEKSVSTEDWYSPSGILGLAYVMTEWKKTIWEKHNQQTPIEYVEHILTGYKEQGFSGRYLRDLWYALYREEKPPEHRA